MTFFLFCVYALALLYSLVLRLSLRVIPVSESRRHWPNEWIERRWYLTNAGPLPAPQVLVNDTAGGMETLGRLSWNLALWPWRTVVLDYRFRARSRGRHPMGPLTLRGADPLGLFPFLKTLAPQREVLIYPPLRSAIPPLPIPGLEGNLRQRSSWLEDPYRIRGYRPYESGDDLRRVDPFVSARFGQPMVRLTDSTRHRRVWVWLEVRPETYPYKGRTAYLESALSLAATVLYRTWSQAQPAGLVTTALAEGWALAATPAVRADHLLMLLEDLALWPAIERRVSAEAAQEALSRGARSGDVVVWIGPPPQPDQEEELQSVAWRRAVVVRLVLATERLVYRPDPSWIVHRLEALG